MLEANSNTSASSLSSPRPQQQQQQQEQQQSHLLLNESGISQSMNGSLLINNSVNLNTSSASSLGEEHHSYQLNEKVTHLATSIYQELEKIIKNYGRDTVKDLMPIVVNVLEALDMAYQEKEEQIVENELLKDDNEQLLNQYEREKQSRKETERVI